MICSSWPSSKIHSDRVHQKRKARRNRLCHDAPLICGTVKRPIDSNNKNAIVAKSRVLKRISKNDSALQKHMQWLKQLQEDRRKVDEKKEIEEQQRLKRRSEFMEREAKKRLLKKASKEETCCEVDDDGEISLSSQQPQWDTPSVSGMESKSSVKPAWCQSEEANESAEAMAEINDEADLLDFVQDLDFDQYDQDLELQALMTQVKERIKKIQREKKKDETTLQLCVDSETATARAEKLDNQVVVDFVPSNMDASEDEPNDINSIANTVMSESTIRSVHSRKSLAVLVTKARERIIGMMDPIEEGKMPQPNQSTITDDDGKKKKIDVYKLPFQNRNPAV
eukprot:CAMPEP_0201739226 /NCGR_PEP_ID=MMETSP0593-20130828/45668_1 /ASSEMBLY_ACC=CAM_ASM_000672 /TAXON_ID=267983 /ORGANISM="Skeletonema japonicum, Strain CCMP2506" /LENGTH=338 /DNA_ID=CAMNT_0048233481 /DNA_START=101 /DNA_END=1117 /DNA_ORIENTATION=+